ncbi:MAG: ADP-ribosylglycohydrolase family protein [Bacteroidales bacterium]|nr:ADP-ribosylglycohydrolase family protein [Bacteroidales bacterium]
MLGAIIGDTIGSVHEFEPFKTKDFELLGSLNEITDDSYLTMAVFCALEQCHGDYKKLSTIVSKELIKWYANYPTPMGGYGKSFENWAVNSLQTYKVMKPYNSYGNGAAMRVSPVAYFARSLKECIELSRKVTKVTHNHPEGIKGSEATAVAIYMALHGSNKEQITEYIRTHYYPLNENTNQIRKHYGFEPSCQETVPQSIQAFLDSTCYEDAIRIVVSLGGDADTMGAITGAIAEAYYGIPNVLEEKVFDYLDEKTTLSAKRMIDLRDKSINRYLETGNSKKDFQHSMVTGSDMDGYPDINQRNAAFKYNGILYQCKGAIKFVKIIENNIEAPMNEEDFQFFIDEIRCHLFRRFANQISSVEDFYNALFLELSSKFWDI